jgi:Transglycosylase SLT domain
MGLMQLMPATAAEHGVLDPFNPAENIRAGVRYLKQLLVSYEGRVELALAAYNAGPGAVKKYGGKVPPYRETQNYVARIQNTGGSSGAPAPARRVYRTVEIVDGREVVRYSGTPRAGSERLESAERR